MSLFDSALPALEIALNRLLDGDADARAKLRELPAEPINVYLRDLRRGFSVRPVSNGLQLGPLDDTAAAAVDTTLVTLGRVAAGADVRTLGDALRIEGDADHPDSMLRIFRQLDFDLAGQLQRVVGEDIAPHAEIGLRKLLDFGRRTARALVDDSAEYMREETRELVSRVEVEEWMDAVDELAAGTDRLKARLTRLKDGHR